MADDKTKLKGQRNAVREHIEKYNKYPNQEDKDFALKTIRNAQNHIKKILSKHSHWDSSYEDDWSPK